MNFINNNLPEKIIYLTNGEIIKISHWFIDFS